MRIIVEEQPNFFISILYARLPVAPDARPVFLATLISLYIDQEFVSAHLYNLGADPVS